MIENDRWSELYQQSRRNAPIEPPPPAQRERIIPPVPPRGAPPNVTVITPIQVGRDQDRKRGKQNG